MSTSYSRSACSHTGEILTGSPRLGPPCGILVLPESAMTCFNTQGMDHRGKTVHARRCGVARWPYPTALVRCAGAGECTGDVPHINHTQCGRRTSQAVEVVLHVSGDPVVNNGFDPGKSLSRLAWLNTDHRFGRPVYKRISSRSAAMARDAAHSGPHSHARSGRTPGCDHIVL